MRRLVATLAAAWLVALPGLLTLSAGPVAADSAPEYGSWNDANQDPGGLPVSGLPAEAPAPASTTLFVASDPNGGAQAIVALRTAAPEGSTAKLTLASSAPVELGPGAAIVACPVVSTWKAATNASWNDKPAYVCGTTAAGQVDSSGMTAVFSLGPDFARPETSTIEAVITIIGGGGEAAFNPPDSSSFQVTSPEPATEPEATSVADVTTPPSLADTGTTATLPPSPAFDTTAAPALATPPTTVPPPAAALPAARPAARHSPLHDTSGRERTMAVAALLAMLGGLWWVAGQPVRAPRLLGSVAKGRERAEKIRVGGIGRFARVREAAPNRVL